MSQNGSEDRQGKAEKIEVSVTLKFNEWSAAEKVAIRVEAIRAAMNSVSPLQILPSAAHDK